jgi:RimJ/RimL family protein N-acetyltransferase
MKIKIIILFLALTFVFITAFIFLAVYSTEGDINNLDIIKSFVTSIGICIILMIVNRKGLLSLIKKTSKINLTKNYIFKSERLGFRNWNADDLTEFAKLNADEGVMEHFPKTLTELETTEFIVRLQKHYKEKKYTYFVTEVLATGEFIGFIGMAYQDYKTEFTPATDIGWRLKQSAWGKGYATEGAKACLDFGFNNLNLDKIISTCTLNNTKSAHVMAKIGMKKVGTFNHPKLKDYPDYETCICYEVMKVDFK